MQRADEKTTVPNPSAATDGEQSLFKEPDASIADFPLPDNEDFSDDFFRRINDPGFLPTYSMPELYGSIFHSKPPIIQNLLYPGTYLFAGAPKIGKSFLMAQLAFHVSSGKPLWNFAVQQGTVLYVDMLRKLSAIGNNVNQIAHWANSKGYVSQAEIHEAAVRVNEAYMMVRDAFR